MVSYFGQPAGVTVDLAAPANNTGEALGDSYVSIESAGGTAFADALLGTSGPNTLLGRDGADVLDGREGADILNGGAGHDVLTGGNGADQFQFRQLSDSSWDQVADFSHNQSDRVVLLKSGGQFKGFTGTGSVVEAGGAFLKSSNPQPTAAVPTVLYNTTTGEVFVDLDGTGGAYSQVKLLEFTVIPSQIYAVDFQVM